MTRLRWCALAAGLLSVAMAAGCGTEPAVVTSTAPVTDTDLDVFLEAAEVHGMQGASATPLPAGTLHDGEALVSYVSVRPDSRLSTLGLVYFAGAANRVGGGAELGVTGVCGRGWDDDGRPVEYDPCSAAEPVPQIPAGEEYADDDPDLDREAVFTMRTPVDVPWHIILLRRDDGGWKPCATAIDVTTTERSDPMALIAGGCARG